eukprot:m.170772 g.170772  ORF g.170772 m.170772 type:complete len:89 (-) comp16488_c3_seq9:436-702(-)
MDHAMKIAEERRLLEDVLKQTSALITPTPRRAYLDTSGALKFVASTASDKRAALTLAFLRTRLFRPLVSHPANADLAPMSSPPELLAN